MQGLLRAAVLDAVAVVLPVTCAGCGRPDRALCLGCRAACLPMPERRPLLGGLEVVSAVRYEGVVREAMLAFKEKGRTDIVRPLGRALASALEVASALVEGGPATRPLELCAAPSTASARRRRGYQPVELLLAAAGFRASPVLAVAAARSRQKSLGRQERALNLRDSLRAIGSLAGRRFLLIDDVVTTGATLREVARAVREAGGEVVGAATVASTPRRSDPLGALAVSGRDIHRCGGYGE